jgi:hypothetical protein
MMHCPECGKKFFVEYPQMWRYKINGKFFCRYNCFRRGQLMAKVTLEQKKKAVQIAIDGEDPRDYLKKLGSKNPQALWTMIKQMVKETDPETYEKIPDLHDVIKAQQAAEAPKKAEALPTVKVDGPLKIETPEAKKITVAEVPELKPGDKVVIHGGAKAFLVTAIDTEYGEFYHDKKYDCIDWRDLEGDEVSMKIEIWKKLAAELPDILAALGVKV